MIVNHQKLSSGGRIKLVAVAVFILSVVWPGGDGLASEYGGGGNVGGEG